MPACCESVRLGISALSQSPSAGHQAHNIEPLGDGAGSNPDKGCFCLQIEINLIRHLSVQKGFFVTYIFLKFHTEILINFNNGFLLVFCFVSCFKRLFHCIALVSPKLEGHSASIL